MFERVINQTRIRGGIRCLEHLSDVQVQGKVLKC